jgi:serpin B
MDPQAQLLLVNALALRAKWSEPFKHKDTEDRAFTDASGTEHRVPTMFNRLPRPSHAWTVEGPAGDAVEVVAMRCQERPGRTPGQEGAPAQVSFVLGAPGRTAAEVLPAAWAPAERRRPVEADRVTIALPRLSLRTHLDVARHLGPLGAGQVCSTYADLSGLSPEPLRVSGIVQESLVKVDELGVEAAARTEVTYRALSAGTRVPRVRHIAFDRPFGIVIFDGPSGIPLFTAWQAAAPRPD